MPMLESKEIEENVTDVPQAVEHPEEENRGESSIGPRGADTSLRLEPIARICKSFLRKLKIQKPRSPLKEDTRRGVLRLFSRGED